VLETLLLALADGDRAAGLAACDLLEEEGRRAAVLRPLLRVGQMDLFWVELVKAGMVGPEWLSEKAPWASTDAFVNFVNSRRYSIADVRPDGTVIIVCRDRRRLLDAGLTPRVEDGMHRGVIPPDRRRAFVQKVRKG
jgi:hypothetical protein